MATRPQRSTWLILLLGTLSTAGATMASWRQENLSHEAAFQRGAAERLGNLQSLLDRGRLAAELLVTFVRASEKVEDHEFQLFAEKLLAAGFGASWVAERRPTAAATHELLRVVPVLRGDEAGRLLGPADRPVATVTRRETGRPCHLLIHKVTLPDTELTVALDVQAMVDQARRPLATLGCDMALVDATIEPHDVLYAPSRLTPEATLPTDWQARAAAGLRQLHAFGDRSLELVAFPGAKMPRPSRWLTAGLLGTGVALTTVALLGFRHATRTRRRIEQVVVDRTRQLAEANASLEHRVAARTRELAAANAELEAFNYSVSHDLRAPLRAIAGFAGILTEDHGHALDDDGHRVLAVVRDSCQRMNRLIDALLRLSRLGRQALAIGAVDLDATVAAVLDELRQQGPPQPATFDVGQLGTIDGDATLLTEVFRNLLANAVKFSRDRAEPRIGVRRDDTTTTATITIADNGVGFDPAHAAQLFTPFHRLHRADEFEGTGIGLALCRRVVERHGGTIDATAVPGEGATFRLHLPKHGSVS